MTPNQRGYSFGFLANAHIDESNYAGMGKSAQKPQFAKIFVLRNKHTLLVASKCKQILIGSLAKTFSCGYDIVPKISQCFLKQP